MLERIMVTIVYGGEMRATLKITTLLLLLCFILVDVTIAVQAYHRPQSTCYINVRVTIVDPSKVTITVDQNNSGDYQSIQEALDNAPANATIYINRGVYNETVIINKPVTLIGAGKDKTITNPISKQNKYAIYICKPGVTIKNMSVTNGGDGLYTMGIQIVSPSTRLENLKIYDVPVGVGVWSSNNIIVNSTFQGNKDEGIALLGSLLSSVENNSIINCTFQNNTDGVELQYASNNRIVACKFLNNSHDGISAIASKNNNNVITHCKLYNNRVHSIYIATGSIGNRIINCSILERGVVKSIVQQLNNVQAHKLGRFLVGIYLDGEDAKELPVLEFMKGVLRGYYSFTQLKTVLLSNSNLGS